MVASARRKARESADDAPDEDLYPTDEEMFALNPKLVRMVLRVHPELQEDLISISERLFDETRLDYSYAAIIRGLISLGVGSLAGKQSLAVEFAGARVPRGRRRGQRPKRKPDSDE